MSITQSTVIASSVAVIAAATLGATANANSGGEDAAENEKPIPAAQYQQATRAALAVVPGKVTGTEAGDEEGAFEIEVTRANGREVDVHLDARFNVLDQEAERAEAGDRD